MEASLETMCQGAAESSEAAAAVAVAKPPTVPFPGSSLSLWAPDTYIARRIKMKTIAPQAFSANS